MSANNKHLNSKRRTTAYNPEADPKNYKERHTAAVKQVTKHQEKLWRLFGTSSIGILTNEFLGNTIFISPGGDERPQIDKPSTVRLIKDLQTAFPFFEFSQKIIEELIPIKPAQIVAIVANFAQQNSFVGKFLEIGHIANQLLTKLDELSLNEVGGALSQSANGITLTAAVTFNKRALVMFVILQSIIVDWNDLPLNDTIVKKLLPIQRQVKSLYKIILGEEVVEIPDVMDMGKPL